ncbi:MAG: HlyD family secretion protein [Desulfovibrionaceae bacterium]
MRRSIWMALAFLACVLAGCGTGGDGSWQGYVEGDYVYVGAPLAGELLDLAVARGDRVAAGAPLFALEREYERAGLEEARGNLRQVENTLANLRKGSRPTEVASIEAQLKTARASARLAESEFRRREALYAARTISAEELDQAKAEYDTATQQVRRMRADLATARLGGREDEIKAAEAQVDAVRSRLEQAQWQFDRKVRVAPSAGLVFDTVREVGEWVPAGGPVVVLLPPGNRLVRFYVPEKAVASVRVGLAVDVAMDGVERPLRCRVSYVADEAEYTPPVIYSVQTRAKLVFLVEARPVDPAEAETLKPGQPVTVRPVAPRPAADGGAGARPVGGGGNG